MISDAEIEFFLFELIENTTDKESLLLNISRLINMPNILSNFEVYKNISNQIINLKLTPTIFKNILDGVTKKLKEGRFVYLKKVPLLKFIFSTNEFYIFLIKSEADDFVKNIANFLTLQQLQKNNALYAIDIFYNNLISSNIVSLSKEELLNFKKKLFNKREAIRQHVEDNFSSGTLQKMSNLYGEKNWEGYGEKNWEGKGDLTKTAAKRKTLPARNENLLEPDLDKQFDYRVYYQKGLGTSLDMHPKRIIINTYGGYWNTFFNNNTCKKSWSKPEERASIDLEDEENKFIKNEDTMEINIELGSCDFDVFQRDQLTEDFFKNTHPLLLKRMSDFIKALKKKYPKTYIYLQGASFGGFFVTSYALLQSVGLDESVYKTWVLEAFKEHKLNDISSVDGIMIHSGALYDFNEITFKEPLKKLTVPSLIHQNFDDHRVQLQDIIEYIKQIQPQYLLFSLSRSGSLDFLEEQEYDSNNADPYSLRGHLNNSQSEKEYIESKKQFIQLVETKGFEKKGRRFH